MNWKFAKQLKVKRIDQLILTQTLFKPIENPLISWEAQNSYWRIFKQITNFFPKDLTRLP